MKVIPKFQNSGKAPTRQQIEQNKKKQEFLNQNGIKVKIDGSWGPWQQKQYNKIKSKQTESKWDWFTRIMMGAAMAENPAVMTASGWQQNKQGNYVQKRTKGSDQLADNLSALSWMAPTHPGNVIIDQALKRVVFPATAFLGSKAVKASKGWLQKRFGQTLYSQPIRSSYYRYDANGKPVEFDLPNVASAIKKGKQDFIDEISSEYYREAARNNMIEAQNMGLEYIPVYEKEGFKSLIQDGIMPKFVKSPDLWNASTTLFGGTLGRPTEVTYNVTRPANIRNATAHEVGHVSRWGMGETPKEYKYMKYKTNQLFKNNGDVGVYEFGSQTGEGATNMRDLGREIGITQETPYPGYEEALRRLEEAKSYSTKGGIVDVLRLDKEHMPYIWKALQGLHYSIAPIGFGVASYSNND